MATSSKWLYDTDTDIKCVYVSRHSVKRGVTSKINCLTFRKKRIVKREGREISKRNLQTFP